MNESEIGKAGENSDYVSTSIFFLKNMLVFKIKNCKYFNIECWFVSKLFMSYGKMHIITKASKFTVLIIGHLAPGSNNLPEIHPHDVIAQRFNNNHHCPMKNYGLDVFSHLLCRLVMMFYIKTKTNTIYRNHSNLF